MKSNMFFALICTVTFSSCITEGRPTEIDGENAVVHDAFKRSWLKSTTGKIKRNFSLPEKYLGRSLAAEMKFSVDQFGKCQKIEIVKSSGDSGFDYLVLAAAKESAPFDIPPKEFVLEPLTIAFSSK